MPRENVEYAAPDSDLPARRYLGHFDISAVQEVLAQNVSAKTIITFDDVCLLLERVRGRNFILERPLSQHDYRAFSFRNLLQDFKAFRRYLWIWDCLPNCGNLHFGKEQGIYLPAQQTIE
jgi:hypothetical protein